MNIPEGYCTMFPYVFVQNAHAYLDFLKRAFGAEELGRTETSDGSIANARVRIGTTRFMISEAGGGMKPSFAAFYLYVDDADGAFEQAISVGAEKVCEVGHRPYDERQGGVADPAGNIWWISQRLSPTPYDI